MNTTPIIKIKTDLDQGEITITGKIKLITLTGFIVSF